MDDWIETRTGVHFRVSYPHVEELRIEDISRALSNLCRFTGHCRHHYSIAQHSVYCAKVADAMLRLKEPAERIGVAEYNKALEMRHGLGSNDLDEHCRRVMRTLLLHDATEAYLNDIASPIKKMPEFAGYRKLEARLEQAVAKRFDLIYPFPPIVQEIDHRMLFTEARDLGLHTDEWGWRREPYSWHTEHWTPDEARKRFMWAYADCCR